MSILKKLLHKCSYQLGGKKVNTTSTFPILPLLPKTTDKPEDYKPETYTKMKPSVKGNIRRGIPIKNNNILKPAHQYKRVKIKDNNISPRYF